MSSAVATPPLAQFRWWDDFDEQWTQWHQIVTGDQKCPACCCPSGGLRLGGIPALCECGARDHQEAAEPRDSYDTSHRRACQDCDLNDPDVPTEQRTGDPASSLERTAS